MKRSLSMWALAAALTVCTADSTDAQESRRAVMRQRLQEAPAEQRAAIRMKRAEVRSERLEGRKARVQEKVEEKKQEVREEAETQEVPARGRHEGFARKKAKRRAEYLRKQKQQEQRKSD